MAKTRNWDWVYNDAVDTTAIEGGERVGFDVEGGSRWFVGSFVRDSRFAVRNGESIFGFGWEQLGPTVLRLELGPVWEGLRLEVSNL